MTKLTLALNLKPLRLKSKNPIDPRFETSEDVVVEGGRSGGSGRGEEKTEGGEGGDRAGKAGGEASGADGEEAVERRAQIIESIGSVFPNNVILTQHLLSNPPRFALYITTAAFPKTPNFLSLPTPRPIATALSSHRSRLRCHDSNAALPEGFNFDYFLSIAELLYVTSSAAMSFGLGSAVTGLKNAGFMGSSRVLGGGAVALVMTVGIGVWIRRR